jgi:hypothetical protein
MGKHSVFSFSSMHRRIACPGSALIDNKDFSSESADEGTLIHEYCAEILTIGESKKQLTAEQQECAEHLLNM